MKTFLGMEIEQSNRSIKLHLDHYIHEMLNEYKAYIKKSLGPKRVPFSPFFDQRIDPLSRTHQNRSFTGHLLPNFSLRLRGFVSISRLQYRSWPDSVLRQAQPIGQHFII